MRLNKNMTLVPNVIVGTLGKPPISDSYSRKSGLELGGGADFRYYVFGTALDKLFVGGGIGFTYSSVTYPVPSITSDLKVSVEDKSFGFGAVRVPLYAGWKFIFGKGFALEIDAGYEVGITVLEPEDCPSRLSGPEFGGVLFGIHLGWAF
jgi:hypothetical protein